MEDESLMGSGLLRGMIVRLATEKRDDYEFRDFRLGHILNVNEVAGTVEVQVVIEAPGASRSVKRGTVSDKIVRRCRILPGTVCLSRARGHNVKVLLPCMDRLTPGQLLDYYVEVGQKVIRVSESDLQVGWTRLDPDPIEQLRAYELHNPIWRSLRDKVIEAYAELRSVTLGIEDLVGSRVMLLAHQADVIAQVLADPECRYMLADEVGLGKTVEAAIILKALRRQSPELSVLIVCPDSLVYQWQAELSRKLWLNFAVMGAGQDQLSGAAQIDGLLVSTEKLASEDQRTAKLASETWGLLVVDEVHHIPKHAVLYERVQKLSAGAARVLLLSATPIQRRATEFLALLKLLDPKRYTPISPEAFERMLALQEPIRTAVALAKPKLQTDRFKAADFSRTLQAVSRALAADPIYVELSEAVVRSADQSRQALVAAQELVAYLSENYRIERRVIRNRRSSLEIQLAERRLDESYCYSPGPEEASLLAELNSYVESMLAALGPEPAPVEFARLVQYAAASSPHALLALLQTRRAALARSRPKALAEELARLATAVAPRHEALRVQQLAAALHTFSGEREELDHLIWQANTWKASVDASLDPSNHKGQQGSANRLAAVLDAVKCLTKTGKGASSTTAKTVVFAHWPETLAALKEQLERHFGQRRIALYSVALPPETLEAAADAFQSSPECVVLLSDELGGEGRNFQIASTIVHADLPWTPAEVEQRIGRVDRLGNRGVVTSVVPYAVSTLEADLFSLWQGALELFTRSMSGLEIALETIQDNLLAAFARSPRHGLAELRDNLTEQIATLREQVEEERYFEEGAIDRYLREQFSRVSAGYADGKKLREPLLKWAKLVGLGYEFDAKTDTVVFNARTFSAKSIENAKFIPPSMEAAMRRSRRPRELVISGTFNRSTAMLREELVFFAPTDDPWTDALVANALEADRGRSCAIWRSGPEVKADWEGFDLLYSIHIDARPLFEAGLSPSHLARATGYLIYPMVRVLVQPDGTVVSTSDPVHRTLSREFDKAVDRHLGKREEPRPQLARFKQHYPPDMWQLWIDRALTSALAHVAQSADLMVEEAVRAEAQFARRAIGWRASRRWLTEEADQSVEPEDLKLYERASAALVEGLRQPRIQLESICFWVLRRGATT